MEGDEEEEKRERGGRNKKCVKYETKCGHVGIDIVGRSERGRDLVHQLTRVFPFSSTSWMMRRSEMKLLRSTGRRTSTTRLQQLSITRRTKRRSLRSRESRRDLTERMF